MEDIEYYDIPVYNFPYDIEEDDEDSRAIEQHKQEISRHRQHWARAATPPGYWNIGFPDTQEVAEMNAEAQRMHERKRALVAVEAEYVFVASIVLCVRADGGSCAGVAGSTGGSSRQGDTASAFSSFSSSCGHGFMDYARS